MCFRNLPIEFDEMGRATLKGGIADPYRVERKEISREHIEQLAARNGHIKNVDFDPVTRIAGALAFHSTVDLKDRKVIDTASMATLFRGYEVILKGRDPRDAIFISSRACGVCGGVHSTCSALAIEMAFGICPPPLAVVIRNMALSMEFVWDNIMHLFMLAGPDYSEAMMKRTEPSLLEKSRTTETRFAYLHGYKKMIDIFTDMNPLTGKLYLEGLESTRVAREGYVTLMSKYPHPETIVPGGVSHNVTLQSFNVYLNRLMKMFDIAKKAVGIWEDITQFFYDANPLYKKCGERPANLADLGIWDDPEAYDATYENSDKWGERRWATPGVILDGNLVTTKLTQINVGIEEFVDHSYYEGWAGHPHKADSMGTPLSPYHPWNKETKPKPERLSWREKYSWATAPRWDRVAVEAGTYTRPWITVLANKLPHRRFLDVDGESMKLNIPEFAMPEYQFEWRVPEVWNAFERNRARAYCIGYEALVAYDNWLKGMDILKTGDYRTSTPFTVPKNHRMSVGFWGAGRGWLSHHLEIDKGAIVNYQIVTPSTLNASPKDPWGNPGPYEEAVLRTPLLEEFDKAEDFKGIDILRTLRSFDPCMPCTTHIYTGDATIVQEVNTCACAVDN